MRNGRRPPEATCWPALRTFIFLTADASFSHQPSFANIFDSDDHGTTTMLSYVGTSSTFPRESNRPRVSAELEADGAVSAAQFAVVFTLQRGK
jgi:hypothetical protein